MCSMLVIFYQVLLSFSIDVSCFVFESQTCHILKFVFFLCVLQVCVEKCPDRTLTLVTAIGKAQDWEYYKSYCREDPGTKVSSFLTNHFQLLVKFSVNFFCKCLITDQFCLLLKPVVEILQKKLCPAYLISSKPCKAFVFIITIFTVWDIITNFS